MTTLTLEHAEEAYDAVIIDKLHAAIQVTKADYLVLDTQTVTVVRHGQAPLVRHVGADNGHHVLLEVLGRRIQGTKAPYVVDLAAVEALRNRLPFVSEEDRTCHVWDTPPSALPMEQIWDAAREQVDSEDDATDYLEHLGDGQGLFRRLGELMDQVPTIATEGKTLSRIITEHLTGSLVEEIRQHTAEREEI